MIGGGEISYGGRQRNKWKGSWCADAFRYRATFPNNGFSLDRHFTKSRELWRFDFGGLGARV